jgi:hypothetical protein
LGSLENKGVEMEFGADILQLGDFSWNVSFNSSYNKNKILKLPENENENNRIGGFFVYDPALGDYTWKGGLQEGGIMGDYYGFQHQGIYATDAEAAEGPLDMVIALADKTSKGGDFIWTDLDNNGIIDTRDMEYMGNIFPRWTGGFTTTAAYKGLSLYVRMDYATGHTIYNYTRVFLTGAMQGNLNMTPDVLRAWQEPGDITDVPRHYYADQAAQRNYWRARSGGNQAGAVGYEKGDYLALREITLRYNIPLSWSESIGMNNLGLYVTANNLKYFTHPSYTGLAPEAGGFENGRFPLPRVIMVGVNASF